jgi:hypothetical protein
VESLQIELYFSLAVIAFVIGMAIFFITWFLKKSKEE